MTASKRKNENVDSVTKSMTKMVIVGGSSNNIFNNSDENGRPQQPAYYHQLPPTTSTMDRMKQLRSTWEQSLDDSVADPITQALESLNSNGTAFEDRLLKDAEKIQTLLSNDIHQAKDLCDQESNVLAELASQLAKFQEKRHGLLDEIDDLDDRQRVAQAKIAMYQDEASQELDLINDVEEEKKRQVPRLKTTISLYASTTGIKWDFAHPELLSGQVVSPNRRMGCHAAFCSYFLIVLNNLFRFIRSYLVAGCTVPAWIQVIRL